MLEPGHAVAFQEVPHKRLDHLPRQVFYFLHSPLQLPHIVPRIHIARRGVRVLEESLQLFVREVRLARRGDEAVRAPDVLRRSLTLGGPHGGGPVLEDGRSGRGAMLGEPVTEQAHGKPVEPGGRRRDAFTTWGAEGEAEEPGVDAGLELLQVRDLVLDQVEQCVVRLTSSQLAGSGRPLANDVNEGLGEDGSGARKMSQFEV